MNRFATIACLAIIIASPQDADACSCLPYDATNATDVREAREHASTVFLGTATAVAIESKGSKEFVREIQTTEFLVEKSWKGKVGNRFTTRVDVTCCTCGFAFEQGRKYLVFTYQDRDGHQAVSTCGLSTAVSESTLKTMAILDGINAEDTSPCDDG